MSLNKVNCCDIAFHGVSPSQIKVSAKIKKDLDFFPYCSFH